MTSIVENEDHFDVVTDTGNSYTAASVLIATGGTRLAAGARLAASLGHELQPPTPSLFTFKISGSTHRRTARPLGESCRRQHPAEQTRSSGPVLITHWGLSGPGILKISAWGARELAARDYRFDISVNWLPDADPAAVIAEKRLSEGKRQLVQPKPVRCHPEAPLGASARSRRDLRHHDVVAAQQDPGDADSLGQLTASTFTVSGKSTNKDEFVTCGGISLDEIDFKTMESKLVPGLYFAGEVIDVDGVTGGFNFQNAWTTGFHAGSDIAAR